MADTARMTNTQGHPVDISPEAVEESARRLHTQDFRRSAEQLRALRASLTAKEARCLELEQRLLEIGDKAHDKSTGPAVHDGYWDIRGMAYEMLKELG